MSYNNNGGFEDVVKQLTNRGPQTVQQPLQPENIHTLLNASIEKIAQEWIDQLHEMQSNAQRLESQLMSCVAQTKASVNRLHELGQQVAAEAARGREVCEKIALDLADINPPAS